jgi:predicted DNA binding protein
MNEIQEPIRDPFWQTAHGTTAAGKPLLTTTQLEVLELARQHGMALRAIALHLDISVSSVRDRLRRAEQLIEIRMRETYFSDNPTDPRKDEAA